MQSNALIHPESSDLWQWGHGPICHFLRVDIIKITVKIETLSIMEKAKLLKHLRHVIIEFKNNGQVL